jgi:CIC family chloride channel protein
LSLPLGEPESSEPIGTPATNAGLGREGERLVAGLRRRHERRRRLFPRVLLVGVVVGLVSSFFRAAVDRGEELRGFLSERLHPYGGLGFIAFVGLAAGVVAVAVLAVRRISPAASGSGIPHLKAVLHRHRKMPGWSLIAVKFFGGVGAISSGLTLGREGPTIQMGGALGSLLSRRMRSTAHERQVLIAAGAGAGLAAAFNAPLAGLIFVLEEIQKNFAPGVFTATFLASVTADTVSRVLFGQRAIFPTLDIAAPPLAAMPLFALLGAAAGLLGVAFNRGLLFTLGAVDRLGEGRRLAAAALLAAAVAALAWFRPAYVGGGGRLVERALAGNGVIAILLSTVLLRYLLTLGSYGTGAPGGIFAPLLVLGSQAGLAIGLAAAALSPSFAAAPAAWAVAGMAALFSATVRAPLTGIVLMLEMTETYSLMLPLLIASFAAQWMADLLRDPPIYDALLERELQRSTEAHRPTGALMLELDVLPGAAFAGRRVAEIGLPPGLLIVAIERRGLDHVATGSTLLQVGDRLAVAVAPEAVEALGTLRSGLGLERS